MVIGCADLEYHDNGYGPGLDNESFSRRPIIGYSPLILDCGSVEGGNGWNDRNIDKAFLLERATILAPVLGYKTNLSDYPVFDEINKEILDEEQFLISDFMQNERKLYNFEGTNRAIFIRPSNLKVNQAFITNNYPNLDPKGIKLEFSLPKGSYATILLNELRKSS